MGLNNSLDISVSAIAAERTRMELIASNLANINTTRTEGGGPYKRKMMLYTEKPISFSEILTKEQNRVESRGGGVEYRVIDDNDTQFQRVYNPGHPDADANGFVTLPNVSMATEMTDLVYVSKVYEANISVFNATKKMAQDTLQIQ